MAIYEQKLQHIGNKTFWIIFIPQKTMFYRPIRIPNDYFIGISAMLHLVSHYYSNFSVRSNNIKLDFDNNGKSLFLIKALLNYWYFFINPLSDKFIYFILFYIFLEVFGGAGK